MLELFDLFIYKSAVTLYFFGIMNVNNIKNAKTEQKTFINKTFLLQMVFHSFSKFMFKSSSNSSIDVLSNMRGGGEIDVPTCNKTYS